MNSVLLQSSVVPIHGDHLWVCDTTCSGTALEGFSDSKCEISEEIRTFSWVSAITYDLSRREPLEPRTHPGHFVKHKFPPILYKIAPNCFDSSRSRPIKRAGMCTSARQPVARESHRCLGRTSFLHASARNQRGTLPSEEFSVAPSWVPND